MLNAQGQYAEATFCNIVSTILHASSISKFLAIVTHYISLTDWGPSEYTGQGGPSLHISPLEPEFCHILRFTDGT